MKNGVKFLVAALVGTLVGGGSAYAQTQSATVTNRLGQVITVTLTDSGPASGAIRAIVPAVGAQVDTNITLTTANYTPREIGDLLIGTYSSRVYIATSITNWLQLK